MQHSNQNPHPKTTHKTPFNKEWEIEIVMQMKT